MNRLAGETSPYLLQHAGNPVDWYPWGEEALEQARSRDVPILLSIGYAACHWCHVMEHESFEDAAVAEVMNRLFVNVKVDREERPDLDGIYMNAVIQFTGGHGGWPMTVFLLPTGEPFYGGTYYPPQPRMGLPGFGQLLEAVSEAYHQRRDEVGELAGRMAAHLREVSAPAPSSDPLAETVLSDAVQAMGRVFDPEWGGFGRAPKFPPASAIEFLLRMHRRDGDAVALEMSTATLDGMALGGMYDLLGGGFARYSVDERWLVPHFEKMLYDNAQLAAAYLHAWVVTGRSHYREVCERTLDFVIRDLGLQEGVFASALDADTDGVEGTTYVWTPDEIRAALGSADAETAIAYYGVELPGNFEGASVLRVQGPAPDNLERIRARLHEVRAQRPQPARDDKAIACWNGLAVSALAEAGWRLDRPDLLDAAVGCAEFLLREMSDGDGRLLRSYRAGRAQIPGYLEDYGAVALGLLDLHTATGDPRWLAEAERLMTLVLAQFSDDQQGGFFTTAADGERLVARLKQLDDSPTPSGQSLAATALLKLARIRGRDEWEQRAVSVLRLALPHMRSSPHGLGQTLSALDIHLSPPQEIVVVGEPGDPATAALRHAARAGFRPNAVYAFADGSSPAQLPLLEGKGLVDGGPAVYICERFTCRAPLTDPAEVEAALR